MRWPALLAAVVLVSVGVAFVLTGFNRDAAPCVLPAGIICALAVPLPGGPPRRRR